jgi:hypothetical protein
MVSRQTPAHWMKAKKARPKPGKSKTKFKFQSASRLVVTALAPISFAFFMGNDGFRTFRRLACGQAAVSMLPRGAARR